MKKFFYAGSQGDETPFGYTFCEHYISAETGESIFLDSREAVAAFKRSHQIISWEEFHKIRDEIDYGQVINHYLKFSLKDRNWRQTIEGANLDIKKLLDQCTLITNSDDCILTNSCGIFPSRIFEVVSLLESNLSNIHDEKVLHDLQSIIDWFKAQQTKIFINFAERDLANANHNEILKTLTNIYYKFPDYLQRSIDTLLEFDSKTSGVIDEAVISELQKPNVMSKLLFSFYDYYDFNSLIRKSERNYPIYCGSNILECLAFECIQYPHYIGWQSKRFDTGIENAVVSPETLRLLKEIYSNEKLYDLIEIAKQIDVSEFTLEKPEFNNVSKRLVLSDSSVEFGDDNKLYFK